MKVLGPNLDLVNKQVKNLADGSAATDAVTKQQLDAAIRGLDWKDSVRAASTANITLTSPGTTIDGVTMAVNDRFLAKDQSTASQNGIYVFQGSAATATRATDADASAEVTSGMAVSVTEGTTNGDKTFILTTNDPIVLATTALSFSQLGGAGSVTAGNGLTGTSTLSVLADPVSGGGISVSSAGVKVDTAVVVRKFAQSFGNGSLTTFTIAHGLGTADLTVTVYTVTGGEVVYPDITIDATNVVLTFATAPTTNQYRLVAHG